MIDSIASLVMDWIMVGLMATLFIACLFLLGIVAYIAVKDLPRLFK